MVRLSALAFFGTASGFFWMQPVVAGAGVSVVPEVSAVLLDGMNSSPRPGKVLRVPSGTRDVEIRFGLQPTESEGVRVRYRLHGFDSEWQDLPLQMRAVVHFTDSRGVEVGASHAQIKGKNGGWRADVPRSVFKLRTIEAAVPSRAEYASLEFVSGGGDSTLGVYAFRDVSCEVTDVDARIRRFEFSADTGVDLGDMLGAPEVWQRIGSKPEMAVVLPLSGGASMRALALWDWSGSAYCGWRLAKAYWIPVRAGERVRVRWQESYSIGGGGGLTASYRFLRPGAYRFEMMAANVSGEPLGKPCEISLIVEAPLWQRPWMWVGGAMGAVAVVALGVRRVTQQRMERELAEVERQRALENERARIAQDIHDDLGAGLAQIAMLSELAQMDVAEGDPRRGQLDEIGARAHAAGRKLDEIVWAINPAHDSAEDLVGYLARFAQSYLSLAQIRFRLDVPPTLPEIGLTSRQRHQIFLAAKEAIHNAVKHGAADEITVQVRFEAGCLEICVSDDGCGFFETEEITGSRGSASMRSRMEKLGGQFHRETRPGAGTRVTFTLPLIPGTP